MLVYSRKEGHEVKEGVNVTKTEIAWHVVIKVGNEFTRLRLPIVNEEFTSSFEIYNPEDKLTINTQVFTYETKGI